MDTPDARVAMALSRILEPAPDTPGPHFTDVFGSVRRWLVAYDYDCPPLGDVKRILRSTGLTTATRFGTQRVPDVRIMAGWSDPRER